MKKIFLIISLLSILTFSSCENNTNSINPFLSESDKNISTEFLKEKTYQ
jgi:outer membrane lipoprotein SlyB